MLIERMNFRLKYGRESEGLAIWEQTNEMFAETPGPRDIHYRCYSNLTGRASTISQDFMLKNLNEHNPMMYYWKINTRVQEAYARFIELCETSAREMWNIEHETGTTKNFKGMMMERHQFRLQFGKARDSIALWKEIMNESAAAGGPSLRMMTDIAGESYMLVVEACYPGEGAIKPGGDFWLLNDKMKSLHQKFIPLCHTAERDYLRIVLDF